jgi:GNAT superfamily N-acetyltransferase
MTDYVGVQKLNDTDSAEALAFLAARPLHTVSLAGFIRDNGLISPFNRGSFYAYRNELNELEGVALIGHATLFEARSEAAVKALALAARCCPHVHMLVGEQRRMKLFWRHYGEGKPSPRLVYHELLYGLHQLADAEAVEGLRLATTLDVELLLPVYAAMAFNVSGKNPYRMDPAGFRQRWARRIEQGRAWVWVEGEEILFTACVASDIQAVAYLEGVHVNYKHRGKGYGLRCITQLSRNLLTHAGTVCGFVDKQNKPARSLYEKAGYKIRAHYQKIYL